MATAILRGLPQGTCGQRHQAREPGESGSQERGANRSDMGAQAGVRRAALWRVQGGRPGSGGSPAQLGELAVPPGRSERLLCSPLWAAQGLMPSAGRACHGDGTLTGGALPPRPLCPHANEGLPQAETHGKGSSGARAPALCRLGPRPGSATVSVFSVAGPVRPRCHRRALCSCPGVKPPAPPWL